MEGRIYLVARQARPYDNMVIRLVGNEYVEWSEGPNESKTTFANHYRNYESTFTVVDFKGSVQPGQYVFPFGFLLPATMSGSYNYDDCSYIRYTLMAVMNHPTNRKQSQIYGLFLNIMEPPRSPVRSAQMADSAECCCCEDYGTTVISLKVDKNFAFDGDRIQVSGTIDQSRSSAEMEGATVSLSERREMISSEGGTSTLYHGQYHLGKSAESRRAK